MGEAILTLVNAIAAAFGIIFLIVLISAIRRKSKNTLIYILCSLGLFAIIVYLIFYFTAPNPF